MPEFFTPHIGRQCVDDVGRTRYNDKHVPLRLEPLVTHTFGGAAKGF